MTTANSCFWLGMLFFAACLPSVGADLELKAGGIALTLPGPANDFVEAGDKLRSTFFELMVPSNRLVSAYLPAQTLAELNTAKRPTIWESTAWWKFPDGRNMPGTVVFRNAE